MGVRVGVVADLSVMGVRVGVAKLERFVCFRVGVAKHFLDQSIGIDETNTNIFYLA